MEKTSRISDFLTNIQTSDGYRGQIVHIEHLPAREPVYKEPSTAISPAVKQALEAMGITSLYSHQAEAIDLICGGSNTAIVTSTASGKTICYNIPVLEALLDDPEEHRRRSRIHNPFGDGRAAMRIAKFLRVFP